MRLITILSAAALAALPAFAFAQPAPGDAPAGSPPPPPGMWHHPGGHGGWHPHGMDDHGAEMLMKFYAANTTHDGHLTLAQAKAADMKMIVEHFDEIDFAHHGYVTPYDIEAWRLDDMAKHLEKAANDLRAKDR